MREPLLHAFGIPGSSAHTLSERLKTILRLCVGRNRGTAPGRGRACRNCLLEVLDAALAVTLQRAFIPPTAIAAMLVEHRHELEASWARAWSRCAEIIVVEIDAFSGNDRAGQRTGRFSEDTTGTLTLGVSGRRVRRAALVAAPGIEIDLDQLYSLVIRGLFHVGIPLAELRRAEHMAFANGEPCASGSAVMTGPHVSCPPQSRSIRFGSQQAT